MEHSNNYLHNALLLAISGFLIAPDRFRPHQVNPLPVHLSSDYLLQLPAEAFSSQMSGVIQFH